MTDKPKCNACGLEIHRDSGIAYMGLAGVRHKHRSDCIQPLKDRITELEKDRITELERQLAEAKEDTALQRAIVGLTAIERNEHGMTWAGVTATRTLKEIAAIDAARKERG